MKCQCLLSGIAALAFATILPAQSKLPGGVISTPVLPFILQQTVTTGMVGFTTNQTARLNVLNLNLALTSTTGTQPANCTVELQFLDDKGALVKQETVSNFAPGTATSFDLTRATVTSETAARAEIRGVVVVNPSPTPVGSPAEAGNCSVMTTLEIMDSTGSTVSLTSDTRPLGGFSIVPLAAGGIGGENGQIGLEGRR